MKREEFIKKLRHMARSRGIPDLSVKTMSEEDLLHDVLVCKTCGEHYIEEEDLDIFLAEVDNAKEFIENCCTEKDCSCYGNKIEKNVIPVIEEMFQKLIHISNEHNIDVEDLCKNCMEVSVRIHQSYLYQVVSESSEQKYEYFSAVAFRNYIEWINDILD